MSMDAAWHQEQLAEAHHMVDHLEQQNDFLRAELAKHGVIVEGEHEHRHQHHEEGQTFALGGVPEQQHNTASFSDSASAPSATTAGMSRQRGSDSGDSISAVRQALLTLARESDAACDELQQMIDKIQGQLSASSCTGPPSISPFAAVAAGTKEQQAQNTKLLCSEASRQAVEVRSRLASLMETLQQGQEPQDPAECQHAMQPVQPETASTPERVWRPSLDIPAARASFDFNPAPATRQPLDFPGSRSSLDLQSKPKQSVSFQTLDQPAFSVNLDSFSLGKSKLSQQSTTLDSDYDTSHMDNPLFGSTMTQSNAAQMMQTVDEEGISSASQEQLAQSLQSMQKQVRSCTSCAQPFCLQAHHFQASSAYTSKNH